MVFGRSLKTMSTFNSSSKARMFAPSLPTIFPLTMSLRTVMLTARLSTEDVVARRWITSIMMRRAVFSAFSFRTSSMRARRSAFSS